MKLVYQASNTVEGHIIVSMLEQIEVEARLDGQHLQGGVGELQAMGYLRVMVADEDYTQAKVLIDEWEQQKAQEQDSESIIKQEAAKKKASWIYGGLVLILILVIALLLY